MSFKSSLSLFFALSLLLQIFSREIVFLNFGLHREYIASNLCENKSKPSLHCHGKCYLAKSLKKTDSKEDASPSSFKGKVEIVALMPVSLLSAAVPSHQHVFSPYRLSYSYLSSTEIFHPPLFS